MFDLSVISQWLIIHLIVESKPILNWSLNITEHKHIKGLQMLINLHFLGKPVLSYQSQRPFSMGVGCMSNWQSGDCALMATFVRRNWSWNIFCGHSLPSADSRRAVVSSGKRMCTILDNSLRGLSLPSKSVGWLGHKQTQSEPETHLSVFTSCLVHSVLLVTQFYKI